ncbi:MULTISPECIES: hypothetical protein [Sphingobacterium]|uniref:hypothetical protein n=1 Tax=Sphingobacterium TaxID=28453 RepID=UPI001113119A|nr:MULTISPECIES: hypothetical protein [Sphingobacterium]
MKNSLKVLFVLLLVALFCLYKTYAQAPGVAYNRFQYKRYKWKVLPVGAFRVYYPQGYDSLASFTSVQLPLIAEKVKKEMGVPVKATPNIILYPAIDQLYTSNIGLKGEGHLPFPTIYLKGSRVTLAFDGSYEHFRTQLAGAWARLCWEEQFQNDLEEQALSRRQLMPAWFREGAIVYFARGWRLVDEDNWLSLQGGRQDWEQLSAAHPEQAGQAFCYFLSRRYRPDAARQLVFQLRKGKSLSRAVRLVAKRPLDTLTQQCLRFYRERMDTTLSATDTLRDQLLQAHKGSKLQRLLYSADGKQVAYVTEKEHKRRLYITSITELQQLQQSKSVQRYLLPPWMEDHEADPYPLLHWSEADKQWYAVQPEQGWVQVKRYGAGGALIDRHKLYGVDGVSAILGWSRDQWLMAAYRKAKSDIVVYNAASLRFSPLTDDPEDNTEPAWDAGRTQLLYRSGYPSDSLYHADSITKPYGIYSKTITGIKGSAKQADRLLWRDTAYVSFHDPQGLAGNTIRLQQSTTGSLQDDTLSPGQYPAAVPGNRIRPWLRDYLADKRRQDSLAALERQWKKDEESSFLGGVLKGKDSKGAASRQRDSLLRALAYTPAKVRPYVLQLYSAYFSARINNDYYINRMQPYQGYLGSFKFPEVGAMVNGGFSDLFENHHFNIGYRMPAGTEGSDFFFRYENTAKRLDWHVLFFRKVESLQPDAQRDWKDEQGRPYPQMAKVKTHYYELGVQYPLHYDWSIGFTAAARRDRTVFLASDRYSLNFEALQQWWSINTFTVSANKLHALSPFLYKGWDARLLTDVMVSTGKQATLLYATALRFSYHQPLYRDINFVLRGNVGHSGGQSQVLYNFGGVDNNIVPRTDTTVRFKQEAPYAFQTLVTPFRGYRQNSLYGGSYVLFNADLYIPLFSRLIPLRTGFSALNNLQLGLFTDFAATARKQDHLPAAPTHLQSFGCSARTILVGYPIRFDLAWPQQGFSAQPVWYLSFKF